MSVPERTGTGTLARHAAHALRLAWGASRRVTAAYVAALVVLAAVPLVVAWCTKLLLDALGRDAPASRLVSVALVLAGAGVVAAWLPQVQQHLQAQLQRAVAMASLVRLYEAVNRLPGIARFETPEFLDRLRLAQQSTTGVPASVVQLVLGLVTGLLTTVGFVVSLVAINPPMVVVVLLGAVPALVAELALARRRATTLWHVTPAQRRELVYSMVLTDAQAAKEIRLFGLGDFLLGRIVRERRAADAEQRAVDVRDLRVQGWLSLLSAGVAGAGLVWAVLQAHVGRLSIGDLTLFVAAVAGVQAATTAATQQVAQLRENLLLFGHFVAVVGCAPDLPVAVRPAALAPLDAEIRLEDVWFRYADDLPWVLRGVDLVIPRGTTLALVGVNGAGKSTLVKLLCRFYDPTHGRITWDGTDLRDVDPADLRARLATVFQDFVQYDMTAHDNIGIGSLAALEDQEQVERAAVRSGVDPALRALPRGYATPLTRLVLGLDDEDASTGVPLSGGQWQRLALARAFMREDADLLVLDEPSSGLDAEAEHDIHGSLTRFRQGRTSVLISHRLGAVRAADTIVVLDGGVVAEHGTHDDLVGRDGTYARLFALQRRGYDEPSGTDREPVASDA
ncbi:ABC transporter ATP-binding protein [Cellulomonas gilvus]|uniref:ABC transporter related protein n=1 Tax=Cellulomonas gilvus (strain ATCC 13127 / NRRL B-14078) TaxID=593907 RepID=F8A5M1_CELGA|nr:ABC transporter ATP-binding protein [Cellulomonas gilvus]AEI12176.1 ABC transporter related protein [Cellulomonas gilvus ATCC 13127]